MTEQKPKSARSKSIDNTPSQVSKTSKKSKKSAKDEKEEEKMKPSHTISAYIYYASEMGPKFRAERNCTNTEAMKLAGAGWKELSEKDRTPYL